MNFNKEMVADYAVYSTRLRDIFFGDKTVHLLDVQSVSMHSMQLQARYCLFCQSFSAGIMSKRMGKSPHFWHSGRGISLLSFFFRNPPSLTKFQWQSPQWKHWILLRLENRWSRKGYEIAQWLLLITNRKSQVARWIRVSFGVESPYIRSCQSVR